MRLELQLKGHVTPMIVDRATYVIQLISMQFPRSNYPINSSFSDFSNGLVLRNVSKALSTLVICRSSVLTPTVMLSSIYNGPERSGL